MRNRSKYPSLGIGILDLLDEIFRLTNGFHLDPSKNGLYEVLPPESRPSRTKYSKVFNKLEHSGYIERKGETIILTDAGEEKALLRSMEKVEPPKKKDGFSRLIAFDVPEHMRSSRDAMRQKLYEFECMKVQKSLYLTPYVCEKEIEEIARILHLERYIQVFVIQNRRNFPFTHDRRKKVK